MTTTLDAEVYTVPVAARLLRVPPSTLNYWLEGGTRRGVVYQPIIRQQPTSQRIVTWAEFIEAGWLSAYRRQSVPTRELRTFIEAVRKRTGVPYPLAHEQPLISGRDLVAKAQEQARLPQYWRLVDEQLALTFPGESFVKRVTWEGGTAAGWRPVEDAESTVIVRPDVRFGRPSVGGVSTRTLFEYSEEGASREEICEEFGVTRADVRWALSYENALDDAA